MLPPHMTTPQGDDLATKQAATVPGMAFWAMTGPENATCRECSFWNAKKYRRYDDGELMPRRCRKFRSMSQGRNGAGVPHNAQACKYFQPAVKIPNAISEKISEAAE